MIIYLLVSCNKQLFSTFACARPLSCPDTSTTCSLSLTVRCVETSKYSSASERREKLLITTYQEVNDHLWSHSRCDDENARIGGNTDLPEQHFHSKRKYKPNVSYISRKVIHHPSVEFSFCPVEVKECMCRDGDGVVRTTISTKVIASRPFRLRSKCSICSRRFESRRWSHRGQALSSGFLDIGRITQVHLDLCHGSSRHCSPAVEFGPLPSPSGNGTLIKSKWKEVAPIEVIPLTLDQHSVAIHGIGI